MAKKKAAAAPVPKKAAKKAPAPKAKTATKKAAPKKADKKVSTGEMPGATPFKPLGS